MWGIIKFGLFVGSMIYQLATSKGVKKLKVEKDTSDFPRFREGEAVSVVFGYAYIKDPQIVYYKLGEIKEIGFTLLGNTTILLYVYYGCFQEKLCLSNIDSVEFIFIDGKANRCDWNGNPASPSYYGWSANESEIPIAGTYEQIGTDEYNYDTTSDQLIDIEFGGDTQVPNAYLETVAQQGTTISANRGVVQIVLRTKVIGENNTGQMPELRPWQYLVKRIATQHDGTAQWYDAKKHCGYGMNVIHAIRELIISERIGGGLGSDIIDSTTFEAAADQCYTDGIGVSFHYNNANGTARELIDELLHTYAVGDMHFDMDSATFKIKLFRDDYVYATLDEVVSSNVIVVKNLTKEDANEVTNSVNVMYTDRFNFELKAAPYQDDSSISRIGINPEVVNMPYLMNPEYALKVATQIVLFSTAQLNFCQIEAALELDKYNKGDVFNLTDDRNGLDKVTFRVMSKTRTDRNSEKITLSVVEDIYGIGKGSTGTGDNPPVYPTLLDVKYDIVKEMPFFLNRAVIPDPDTDIGETLSNMMAFAVQPSNYIGFGVWYKLHVDSDYDQYSTGSIFSNVDSLNGAIGYTDIELNVSAIKPFPDGSYIMIDDEIMYQYGNSSNKIYVYRGMQDTLPIEHSNGSIIYNLGKDFTVTYQKVSLLTVDSLYDFKLTSEALSGSQNILDAVTNSFTPGNRSIKPYNGNGFKINEYCYENDGVLWIGIGEGSLIEWTDRNRIPQWNMPEINQNHPGIFIEDGVVYAVEIWDDTDTTLKRVVNLLSAEEYDYTTTLETTDFGALDDKVVKLSSKRLKETTPYVFTNADATSSIVASTGTITYVGQDLTDKVQRGYSITLANFTQTGNNNTFVVATIVESGGDSTIVVTDNTGMVDETMTGLDETLSVPDYWESYQKWSILVKRMSAPTITYDSGTRTFTFTDPTDSYTSDTYFFTYNEVATPSKPSEPSDPTLPTNWGTLYKHDPGLNVWIKVVAVYNGQLSAVAELKNY